MGLIPRGSPSCSPSRSSAAGVQHPRRLGLHFPARHEDCADPRKSGRWVTAECWRLQQHVILRLQTNGASQDWNQRPSLSMRWLSIPWILRKVACSSAQSRRRKYLKIRWSILGSPNWH